MVVRHPHRSARSLRHAPWIQQILVNGRSAALVGDLERHLVGVRSGSRRQGETETGCADGCQGKDASGSGRAHSTLLTVVFSASRGATVIGSKAQEVLAAEDA